MAEKMLKESPSQTAGPYVHIGCTPNFANITGVYPVDLGSEMRPDGVEGTPVTITGTVWDGGGEAVKDCLVEVFQADARGGFGAGGNAPFPGWGRCPANQETGEFRFDTIRPGPVEQPGGGTMAPHLTFWITARGINLGLHTRMYFPDEEAANAADPWLTALPEPERAATLIATKVGEGHYHFDIRLQGEGETVFFDV